MNLFNNVLVRIAVFAIVLVFFFGVVGLSAWHTSRIISEMRSQARFQTCLLLVEQEERTRHTVFRCADEAGLEFELIPDP